MLDALIFAPLREIMILEGRHAIGLQRRLERLLEPSSDAQLAALARQSHELTRKFFGRTMRLFAPLYLSNECINSCAYCGFSRENSILRVTLDLEQVRAEARHLAAQGFRHVLLVAGEHPKFVSAGYLVECVQALAGDFPSIAVEVAPLAVEDYARLAGAGAEALVVYQETYDRALYASLHTAGPKKNYDRRLTSPERAYAGGFRRIGVGALFGLRDWRDEACALAMHLDNLLRTCWKAQFTMSFPRLRPCAGEFTPPAPMSDRDYIQLVCAMRICFPQVGIVLSTREPAPLRDALIPLGITSMSAGSHTEPGGYTGQGSESLHFTIAGRSHPAPASTSKKMSESRATQQFAIADERSPAEMSAHLRAAGFEAVWKDWDQAILASP
jgi:2-iminoacetate synthase